MVTFLSISLSIVAMASTSFATTWTVDDDGNADFTTIQAAIDASSNGDEIIVMPGTYTGTGNWVIDLDGKAIWLHSNDGTAVTFIDGEDARVGIFCNSDETINTIIEGFTITNCSGNSGGMWCWDSTPVLRDCRFASNVAKVRGGGVNCAASASPMFENCSFIDNSTVGDGGAFYCIEGNSVFTSCTFSDNSADNGGAISCHNSYLSFEDCSFTNNAAYDDGGAIQSTGNGFLLTTCAFANNTALSGGAIYNYINSNSVLVGCTFDGNSATESGWRGGGAIHNYDSDPTLTNCIVKSSTADYGGGLWNFRSDPILTKCHFLNNTSKTGGGIYNNESSPVLNECIFENNSSLGFSVDSGGGGMCSVDDSFPLLFGCLFINNQADYGGGMFTSTSDPFLENCIFEDNVANEGDGLFLFYSSIKLTGTNKTQEVEHRVISSYASSTFDTDSFCFNSGNYQTYEGVAMYFDVNDLESLGSLQVDGEFDYSGALAVTNELNTLQSAGLGDIIPLIQASNLTGAFDSITFPTMPEGLGLQLIEQEAPRGADAQLAIEVIEVEEATFATPFDGNLQSTPIDVASFDANGDGQDEIVILYGAEQDSLGGIACYWVDESGAPTLIQGYSSSVGNDPVDLDVGDLNGDGLDDVIVSNGMDKTISVLVTAIDTSNNLVFENEKVISLNQVSTCVAVIDWDGDTITNLDAVVGIDMDDSNAEDGYRVVLDVSGDDSSGPWLGIPFYSGSGGSNPDPPTCVDGGSQKYSWGFVGGTRYGRMHHADATSTLRVLGEIDSVVTTIEALELDRDGGDTFIDLLASSVEAEIVCLFQGSAKGGFEDIILIAANEPVEDVLAIDADYDGDMDIVMAAPTSANTPLTLLRNDGSTVLLGGALKGTTWSKQEMIGDEPVNNLTSGDLNGKDEDDDWIEAISGMAAVGGQGAGMIAQTNLLGDVLPCAADINGDGVVDVIDILAVIAAWGQSDSPADINGDGTVDVADILEIVANWGPCV
jgi:predicted outer membrane repeat protein